MAEDRDLFLFGDDLDAVLEALEADDNVDEYFEEAVTEVSWGNPLLFLIHSWKLGVCVGIDQPNSLTTNYALREFI